MLPGLLADRARARKADTATLAEITELAGRAQVVEALSAAKDYLGAAEFGAVVERHLVPPNLWGNEMEAFSGSVVSDSATVGCSRPSAYLISFGG